MLLTHLTNTIVLLYKFPIELLGHKQTMKQATRSNFLNRLNLDYSRAIYCVDRNSSKNKISKYG